MSWVLAMAIAAGPTGLDLSWSAPDECAARQSLEALVARLLPRSKPLKASVVITQVDQRYRLTLETDAGTRTLDGEQCDEVTNGAALVLAMLMEEERPPAPPLRRELVAVPVPVASAAPEASWFGLVRVSGLGDVGGLPLPTAGARLTGGVGRGVWVGEVSVASYLAQTVPIPQLVTGRARLSLDVEVQLRGCWSPGQAAMRPRLCAGLGVGQFRGTGVEVAQPRSETSLFASALGGVGVVYLVGRFGLLLQADVGLSLSRTSFALDGQPPVFSTPWVVMRAEAGVEWRFP